MAKTTKDKDPRLEPRKARKWTVMVYMAAENNAELDAVAVQDLREMERGANGSAHIVVQINRAWPDSFQRYEIGKSKKDPRRGQSVLIDSDDDTTDMGARETLENFVTWVPKIFPAERYFLVLWGHAYGLGFARDHNNKLTLKELQVSLDAFRRTRNEMLNKHADLKAALKVSDGRLELLGANACAMSYVEAAYELRKSAQYMVASQISVPFAGWPYESILRRVPDSTEPLDLGRLVVDLYVGHYNSLIGGERVAMSLLNLQNLEKKAGSSKNFKDLIERFAVEIRKEARTRGRFGGDGKGPVRDIFIGAAAGDVRPLIDLHDLCQDFSEAQSPALREVAQEIQTFLGESVIVHNGHHSDLDDLKGIGIFAPFVTDEADLRRLQLLEAADENGHQNGKHKKKPDAVAGQTEYEQLAVFGGATASWPRLVYDDLRQEISPELSSSIVGIDATSREDRRDVTQIILAIDSAFNKLDRVLSAARHHVDQSLHAKNGGSPPTAPTGGKAKAVGPSAAVTNGHARRFGLPWLKLIQPIDLETQVLTMRRQLELARLRKLAAAGATDIAGIAAAVTAGTMSSDYLEAVVNSTGDVIPASPPPSPPVTLGGDDPALVNMVIDFFVQVEKAIGDVERASRRGLTHPKLGLGPSQPGLYDFEEGPKPGLGEEPPKSGLGEEPPKSGLGGFTDERFGARAIAGDLRVDLALARVADLFRQVGQSLKALEQATLEVEVTARAVLANAQAQDMSRKDLLKAASEEISRAFRVLEEASTNARRTVRRVLGHPVYGIGPGGTGLGLQERQALASAGGLDRRNLRLL